MNTEFPASEQQVPQSDETSNEVTDNVQSLALHAAVNLFDNDATLTTNEALLEALREHVTMLLSKHPERLMSILYRIDVAEQSVSDVMNHSPVGAIATHIASLILERMREKILTRERYRQQSDTDDVSE